MKLKKLLMAIGSTVAFSTAAVAATSCSKREVKDNDYDFGVAISPINSLNYVRTKSSLFKILPTLVQGLIKNGPSENLKNQLQLPAFTFGQVYNQDADATVVGETGTGIYTLSDYGYFNANLYPGMSLSYRMPSKTETMAFYANINNDQVWKGAKDDKYNRSVLAKDYIDYFKYILDINTGSELLPTIREFRLKGSEELYLAQNEYATSFGDSYQNPFGTDVYATDQKLYWDPNFNEGTELSITNGDLTTDSAQEKYWPLHHQNGSKADLEKKIVGRIRKAAINFLTEGLFTYSNDSWMDEHSDWNYSETEGWIFTDSGDANKEKSYREENRNSHLAFITDKTYTGSNVDYIQRLSYIVPINKDFVDSIGGIYNFGRSTNEFQYSSPFNITDIRLGQGGYIELEKDQTWMSAETVIPNRVKVYFQDDPNIISSFFEDGYISASTIPNVYQNFFWSKEVTRQFMKKTNGTGSLVLQMKIDGEESPLNNQHLRNAINHAINKADLIKLMGWGASFPVSTWTPNSLIKTEDGRWIDMFFDSEEFKPELSSEAYPISAVEWATHQASHFVFENADRTDEKHNIELAKKYFEQYQKETGNSEVELSFLTSDVSGEKAGMGIRSLLNDVFDGKIKINVKKVPASSYLTMIYQGKFDMTIKNFDVFGNQADSYMKHLLFPDLPDSSGFKQNGYYDNPTGGWTFYQWYKDSFLDKYPTAQEAKDKFIEFSKTNLLATSPLEQDIIELLYEKILTVDHFDSEGNINTELKENFNKIFQQREKVVNSDEKLFKTISIMEKIIAISNPVIPLAEVDNNWTISRLAGIDNIYTFNLEFGYDVLNKPKPSLPGKEN